MIGIAPRGETVLRAGGADVRWIAVDLAQTGPDALVSVRDDLVDAGRRLAAPARKPFSPSSAPSRASAPP